jgi:hypothetical protein
VVLNLNGTAITHDATLSGTLNADSLSLGVPVTLAGDTTIAASGDVTLGAVDSGYNGPASLTVLGGTGTVALNAIGSIAALSALSVTGGSVSLGGPVNTSGPISLGAVTLAADTTLSTGGAAAVTIGTLDGPHALTVSTVSGNTTIGTVGGSSTVAKLALTGNGVAAIGVRNLGLLDLGSKTGGSVVVGGPIAYLGDVVTTGKPYSVSFVGGGMIGDQNFSGTGAALFSNNAGVLFAGNYDIFDGLTSIASTTTLSGSINTHDAPLHLGSIIDIGAVTLIGSPVTIDGSIIGPPPTRFLTGQALLPSNLPPTLDIPPGVMAPPSNDRGGSFDGIGGIGSDRIASSITTTQVGIGDLSGVLGFLNPQAGGDSGRGFADSEPAGYDEAADSLGQSAAYTPPSGGSGGGGKTQTRIIIPGLLQTQGPSDSSGNASGDGNGDVSLSADPGGWPQ